MHIEEVDINSLIEYQFNNRVHTESQIDRIANSIQQFGMNQPIVVDEENVILVGHGRYSALKKLGRSTAPIVKKTDLTEVQKKAYRILDNKLAGDSTWAFNNLELELGFLEDNGIDLGEWGLDKIGIVDDEELNDSESPADLSQNISTQYKIEIDYISEQQQEEYFKTLTQEGYICRVLTL